jgi:hypothetical protein
MNLVVTKKGNEAIDLVWGCDKYEITDGTLICQTEDVIDTFEDITSVTHTTYEFDGEIPSDYGTVQYRFVDGQFVK